MCCMFGTDSLRRKKTWPMFARATIDSVKMDRTVGIRLLLDYSALEEKHRHSTWEIREN